MATSYTSLLGFALPVTGELDGTWGDVVNNSITQLVEDSVAGVATTSVAAGDWTLTTTGSGVSNQARCAIIIPTGSPGVSRNVIAPSQSKAYIVINQSDAAIVFKGSATTGVTIGSGDKALVAWNGSDFVRIGASAGGSDTQVQYNSSGNLAGSANLTFDGSNLQIGSQGDLRFGDSDNSNYAAIQAPATISSNYTLTLPTTDGNSGEFLQTDGSGVLTWAAGAVGDVTAAGNNAFTGANTFYNSTGQTFGTATSAQDGIIITGRAGGTNTYRITLTPETLSSSTTLTLPNTTTTVAGLGVSSQVFTTAQTFRAASAVRSEAASAQDAVVLAGRAGGTSSYAVTLTPATLSASRTVTLPDANTTIPVATQVITFTGPSASRTVTLPDANFTAARTDAAQTFTGNQTVQAAATQDAVVLAGRAGGTSSYAVTMTPTTLTASRTLTLPNATGTVALTGQAIAFSLIFGI